MPVHGPGEHDSHHTSFAALARFAGGGVARPFARPPPAAVPPLVAIATPAGRHGGPHPLAETLLQAQAPAARQGEARQNEARLVPLRPSGDASPARQAIADCWELLCLRAGGRLAGLHVVAPDQAPPVGALVLTALAKVLRVPVLLHLPGQLPELRGRLARPGRALLGLLLRSANGVVVGSRAARRQLVHRHGVPAAQVDVVVCGVPEPGPARPRPADAPLQQVLFAGPLFGEAAAGLLHALTLARIDRRRLRLTLAGWGDPTALRQLVRDLGLEANVRYATGTTRDQFALLVAGADVLVLQDAGDAVSLAALQAFARGVAVVATARGELASCATHGVHALFVPPEDAPALAQALEDLLTQPPRRRLLGQRGRALYEQRFSSARFCADMAAVHRHCFGVAARSPEGTPPAGA